MHTRYWIASTLLGLMFSFRAYATTTEKSSYVSPSPVISTEHTLQMIGGLLVVLAIILSITWLLKRFSLLPATPSSALKVVSATAVGQRERVVVVEIQDTWLVLGVAPGHVSKLHSLSKPAGTPEKISNPPVTESEFSVKLNENIHKSDA